VENSFKFIDLFCGIGGFHQALSDLGGECVFASDIDENCRNTYEENYGLKPAGDITQVDEKNIPKHDVLCGGFPCQSFSKAGNRMGISDPRGTLFFDIIRIAKYHKPKYLLLENVRNLSTHDNGRTWKTIHENITALGYNVSENPIVFSPHNIGIPQYRQRVFILCKRKDLGAIPTFNFEVSKDKNECSIEHILQEDTEIENLEKYKIEQHKYELINLWGEFIQNLKGKLPGFPVWADRLKELDIEEDLDENPKWKRNFIIKNNQLYLDNKKFIDSWLKKARSLENFHGSKAKFEWQAGQVENPNIWETIMHFRPSGLRVKQPTYFPALVAITHTSIIGERQRYLTPREGARLQSFPDSLILNKKDNVAYKQLGNSVNVEVVKLFAKFLLFNNEFNHKDYNLKSSSKKEMSIDY
jgi:DNA (cytosine-5)-methyltransferase 1